MTVQITINDTCTIQAANTLTFTTPLTVQARLFGWKQNKGKEGYFRTRDVVVSPPILRLAPGKTGIVRVVRLSKKPVRG